VDAKRRVRSAITVTAEPLPAAIDSSSAISAA